MGAFDWQQEQTVEFILENTGERLLVINDVLTSCDCTTVGYSKEPVHPKDSVALSVTYMAEQPGRFDKIIKGVAHWGAQRRERGANSSKEVNRPAAIPLTIPREGARAVRQ